MTLGGKLFLKALSVWCSLCKRSVCNTILSL